MPERSVSAMRAMFEAKGENTSPPSRGRSPAGSERSNGSRNVSNMRSSFVAVEKSGMLGLRRVSDAEQPADGTSPSQRGRNPLSRTSSLSNVQEEEGGLGTILKGSPFEDSRPKGTETKITKSAPDAKHESKTTAKRPEEAHSAPIQKITSMAQATVNKFKAAVPSRDEKASDTKSPGRQAADQMLPPIATNKTVPKDKNAPGSANTLTSASRIGPAMKVSSPSTAVPAAKPATRKPTEPQGPKLSVRSSRPSLPQEPRAKSPAKPAVAKPRVSDAASLRPKPSRSSLAGADPEFLNRMSRPTAASANKTEKDNKAEEKKPRQSMGKAPESGFLERMMRPTQASASKHQEEQVPQKTAAPKSGSTSNSKVLERLMKPTQASSLKHEKDIKPDETPKSSRNSIGGKSAEPGLLERMRRPTAASSSKHHEKDGAPAEEQKPTTPPRTKTQIVAGALKSRKATETAKSKVEGKTSKSPADDKDAPAPNVAPSIAPEQTQAHIEANRPVVERVDTEKVEGVPHLSATTQLQATEEEARAKRTEPISIKQKARDSAIDAATPGSFGDAGGETGAARPAEEKLVDALEQEQAAAATSGEQSVVTDKPAPAEVATESSADSKAVVSPLASQNVKVNSPTIAAAAGDAPNPSLNEGAQIADEAVKEVQQEENKREVTDNPSVAETVTTVH